jgi:hypothetical protein
VVAWWRPALHRLVRRRSNGSELAIVAAPSVEHDQVVGDDFGQGVSLPAPGVIPGTRLEPAFEEYP